MAGAARRAIAPFSVAAATLLLAAGCGGGGGGSSTSSRPTETSATTTVAASAPLAKGAYVTKMKAIGKSLSASVSAFGSLTNAADAVKALTAAQTALRGAADRIAAITPPDAIKSQHAQLIKGVRDFADELGPIVAKLKKGDMTALSTLGTLKGLAEIQASATAISNKGYKIGG